jgi:hypothetical protein
MSSAKTATGRPRQVVPLIPQLLLAAGVAVALLEVALYAHQAHLFAGPAAALAPAAASATAKYVPIRAWVHSHPALAILVAAATVAVLLAVCRWWLLLWHNEVVARLSGTRFVPEEMSFPIRQIDVLREIARRPKGTYFVGLTPRRGVLER